MAGPSRSWQLCPHGPRHGGSGCPYAHSLLELRAPDESTCRRSHLWQALEVDRFFGQVMTQEQIGLFMKYWSYDPACRPEWAIGLYLLLQDEESVKAFSLPYDFGLLADQEALVRSRNYDGHAGFTPFEAFPELWRRLAFRLSRMSSARHNGELCSRCYAPVCSGVPRQYDAMRQSDAMVMPHAQGPFGGRSSLAIALARWPIESSSSFASTSLEAEFQDVGFGLGTVALL